MRSLAISSSTSGAPPGTVVVASPAELRIATASQDVLLRELVWPDGRPVPDLSRTAGCELRPGERLRLLDDVAAEHLLTLTTQASRHESAWLGRLKRVTTSDEAAESPESDRAALTIEPSAGAVDLALTAAAALCHALFPSGLCAILYQDPSTTRADAPQGLFAPFLPLLFEVDDRAPLRQAVARVAAEREAARERGPYLADLLVRAPALRRRTLDLRVAFVLTDSSGSGPATLQLATDLELPSPEALARLWRCSLEAIERTPGLPWRDLVAAVADEAGRRPESSSTPARPPRTPYAAPKTATERRLALIWASLLRRSSSDIGVEDDFFRPSGDPSLAAQVGDAIRREYGIELPVAEILKKSTIAALTPAIEGRRARGERR